ncbi:DUF4439 domain-containing protein [Sanguibacter gelidistatuariae]|nr:DUF4439 domain-containing protein [Sanguibacter gelidistatuariae]
MISTLLTLLVLSGCGLRLDGPAPAEPVPDADEVSRQAMVADATAIHDGAQDALAVVAPDSSEAASLNQIIDFSALHSAALGGVYASGIDHSGDDSAPDQGQTELEPGSVSPSDGVTPAPPVPTTEPAPASSAEVVALLAQSAARARGSLVTPTDPLLARLYASIATSQFESARDLAAQAGLEFTAPEAFTTTMPTTLPLNLSASDLATVVRSEDSTGFAYEVMAARLSDDARTLATERARVHRARAQTWAELASLDGTSTDPRQVAYTLPTAADGGSALATNETIAALAAQLEDTLATTYATLTGEVDADNRAAMADLLVDSRAAARAWGAPLVAFPGMPEQAATTP